MPLKQGVYTIPRGLGTVEQYENELKELRTQIMTQEDRDQFVPVGLDWTHFASNTCDPVNERLLNVKANLEYLGEGYNKRKKTEALAQAKAPLAEGSSTTSVAAQKSNVSQNAHARSTRAKGSKSATSTEYNPLAGRTTPPHQTSALLAAPPGRPARPTRSAPIPNLSSDPAASNARPSRSDRPTAALKPSTAVSHPAAQPVIRKRKTPGSAEGKKAAEVAAAKRPRTGRCTNRKLSPSYSSDEEGNGSAVDPFREHKDHSKVDEIAKGEKNETPSPTHQKDTSSDLKPSEKTVKAFKRSARKDLPGLEDHALHKSNSSPELNAETTSRGTKSASKKGKQALKGSENNVPPTQVKQGQQNPEALETDQAIPPGASTKSPATTVATSYTNKWHSIDIAVEQAMARYNREGRPEFYNGYEPPILVPQTDEDYAKIKKKLTGDESVDCWLKYKCRLCPPERFIIARATDASGGSLRFHYGSDVKKEQKPTISKEITSPKQTMNQSSFDQTLYQSSFDYTSVQSVAIHNRSFNMINDTIVQELCKAVRPALNPSAPETLSKLATDFATYAKPHIFTAMTGRKIGKIHLAVESRSRSRSQTYLVINVSWLELVSAGKATDQGYKVVSTLLDFHTYEASSTGILAARQIEASLENVGLQKELLTVTTNNAPVNDRMVELLGQIDSLELFSGEERQIRCFLDILSLTVNACLSPFHPTSTLNRLQRVVKTHFKNAQGLLEGEVDLIDGFDQDIEQGIEALTDLGAHDAEREQGMDEGSAPNAAQSKSDFKLFNVLLDDAARGSSKHGPALALKKLVDQVNDVNVQIARKLVIKVRSLARVLHCSARMRQVWFEIVDQKTGEKTPPDGRKILKRDLEMGWTTTVEMLRRCMDMKEIITTFYSNDTVLNDAAAQKVFKKENQLIKADFDIMSHILPSLECCLNATKMFSAKIGNGSAPLTVGYVVPFVDLIYRQLSIITDSKTAPKMAKIGSFIGKMVMDKYYGESSNIYKMAVLLHPSLRLGYLKTIEWVPSWRVTARQVLIDFYDDHYKDFTGNANAGEPSSSPVGATFGISFNLGGNSSTQHIVDEWINSTPEFAVGNDPKDALHYWMAKDDHKYMGLKMLALDVLSSPASSVIPVRASLPDEGHCHGPATISALMCLQSWFKAGLADHELWEQFMEERKAQISTV